MATTKRTTAKATPKKTASKKVSNSKGTVKKPAPKKAASKKSACFLSTACIDYYGMPDNCYQLETLRNFRDSILTKTKQDIAMVSQYYKIAPILIEKMEKGVETEVEYKGIFNCINEVCHLIEVSKVDEAKNQYKKMVNMLIDKYLK